VRAEPMVVGFNFVQAEDDETALTDYSAQIRTVAFLANAGAPVNIALHAGELWLGLVPPDDLTFHIREAVEIAGAKRIGHGVDLAFENALDKLLQEMRERKVAVEINLTSNDQILGVRGEDHPFPAYLDAGVPVVLSTDDVALERVDLTNEYLRAARDYGLSYRELKEIARASLVYSFLPDSEKQKQLARFDAACANFERAVAGRRSGFNNLLLLVKAAY
jgi:adenosine deaminase